MLKVALVSLKQKQGSTGYNLRNSVKQLKKAVSYGAKLVIFPEMTATGYMMDRLLVEELNSSKSILLFSILSKQLDCFIVFGLPILDGDKTYNRLFCIAPNGEIICQYDKIYLFSPAKENEYFSEGDTAQSISILDFRVSFSICYDIRFPEIFSTLSKSTDLYINIASWPKQRVSQYKTLIKARAIENQAYFIGVNRTGSDFAGNIYEKSSLCANPYGLIVKPLYSTSQLDIIEIDKSIVNEHRAIFPFITDKKNKNFSYISR